MPKHFKLRTYHRVMICGTAYYLSEDFIGKGTVWDISSGGWRIQGDHQVRVGMKLTLRMELSEAKAPLQVDEAVVQWVSGRDFGIQIKRIRHLAAIRLERLTGRHLYVIPLSEG